MSTSSNTPEGPQKDEMLTAIEAAIRTMGGDPSQTNAENYLIDQGVFTNKSTARRRLLGCLGCQLKGPGDGAVYLARLKECTEGGHGATSHTLDGLVGGGIFKKEVEGGQWGRTLYKPAANERAEAFMDSLEAPTVCRQKQPQHDRVQLNAEAEAHLIETGVVDMASITRRQALGCLACQLNTRGESGSVQAGKVAECTGKNLRTVTRILEPLAEAGILNTRKGTDAEFPGRSRLPTVYSFNNTPPATEFRDLLEVPETCNLEQETS
jgi:DNA-binding transcriptional ArsR family regulator